MDLVQITRPVLSALPVHLELPVPLVLLHQEHLAYRAYQAARPAVFRRILRRPPLPDRLHSRTSDISLAEQLHSV